MHAQLRHLLDTQHNVTVEVLVLPYEAGEHPGQGQSFALLTFPEPEDPAIVFLDYAHSSGFLEKAHEIRQHTSVFGAVISKSLSTAAVTRHAPSAVASASNLRRSTAMTWR